MTTKGTLFKFPINEQSSDAQPVQHIPFVTETVLTVILILMRKIIISFLLFVIFGCATKKAEPPKERASGFTAEEWKGKIDREAVRRSVRSALSGIKKCYEDQLEIDNNAAGKTVVEFVIGSSGKVQDSRITSTTIANSEAMNSCILSNLQKVDFPKPQDATATVIYPFVFGHKND